MVNGPKHHPIHKQLLIYPNGQIYSLKSNIFLKSFNNGAGYLKINVYTNGKISQKYVHRLVAETFLDNPNSLKYIDHIDRNKSNNNIENLRWCTASTNINNTGNKSRYSKTRITIFKSQETKDYVKSLYNQGYKVMEISRIMNIPRQTISNYIKPLRNKT